MTVWYKDVKNQKLAIALGMGISGYYILSQAFAQLPQLWSFLSKPLMGNVSVITISGGLTLAGILFMYSKY